MTYEEQLQTPEWKAKRLVILDRDNYRCTNCNCERTKFLGLSRNFGIKNLEDLIGEGYSIFEILDNNEGLLVIHKSWLNRVTFVGDRSDDFEVEKLKFAMQWQEPEVDKGAVKGSNRLICFLDNIDESQKFPDLNIHHKFYVIGKKAWEYEDEALVTLCENCHKAEHQRTEIFVYAISGKIMYKAENCGKCGGSGFLPEYSYWQNGVCFSCHGHGVYLE